MIVREIDGAIEVLAPAKLNLFLEILGRRADRYHELETLMIAIDLHDRLRFATAPAGRIDFSCSDPSLPTGQGNLVVQAAQRLRESSGKQLGVTIQLEKAIPAQAGLGGGSSDAAATLFALDRLWGLQMGTDRLDELAGSLGSDVPFFLHGSAAICRGRGEQVEALGSAAPPPGTYWFVLVCPPLGVPTAAVYAALSPPAQPESIGPALDAFVSGDPARLGQCLFNRLESAAEQVEPALKPVRKALDELQPELLHGSLMSGSGSACFGLARDRNAATFAAERLNDRGLGRARVVGCGP
jgi:4-diphosphocytidyl-2-C-methyl-D-erythritol kinase